MADGPAGFTQDFSCPALLRITLRFAWLRVPAFHRLRGAFPDASTHHVSCDLAVLQPRQCRNTGGLGSSPFARHYLGNHMLFSLPAGTKMFQFPAFAHHVSGVTGLQPAGLSHSDISGSKVICTSPELFAAYHVLHRLQEPRHPPYALSYLLTVPISLRAVSAESCTFGKFTFSCSFFVLFSKITKNLLFVQYVKDHSVAPCGLTCVENNGFEPLTPCLQSRCSSQLS